MARPTNTTLNGVMQSVAVLLSALLVFATAAQADESDPMARRIAEQQKAPDRHEFDFRRDAARRPYDVFHFLGLEEGMVALDVGAYAGYTTEMLAAALHRWSRAGRTIRATVSVLWDLTVGAFGVWKDQKRPAAR